MSQGVLLVNLGTPESTSTADVRRYLGEFLMDRHVIDTPWLVRRLIVSGFILPLRPRRSAAAYRKIWDAAGPGTGSPLLHYSRLLIDALASRADVPCELAMRYGEPGISSAVARLESRGVTDILLICLYPQHADSTVTTTVHEVSARVSPATRVRVLAPFYSQPEYIRVMADLIRQNLEDGWDHLLLSYHGLPERHLTKADPTGSHCLQSPDCCTTPSPAHATCYRHQALTTTRLIAEELALEDGCYSTSFQSRLGRLPWLTPYTDETLKTLPSRGVRRLVVCCPAFVADNLETLEEIGLAGRQTFMDAGGESFTLVPCLNDHPDWVAALAVWSTQPFATVAP